MAMRGGIKESCPMPILVASAIALAVMSTVTPAAAMTRQQAVNECRAMHANAGGLRVAERTGVTIPQQVQRCVKGKK
jgi:hypothetical protein